MQYICGKCSLDDKNKFVQDAQHAYQNCTPDQKLHPEKKWRWIGSKISNYRGNKVAKGTQDTAREWHITEERTKLSEATETLLWEKGEKNRLRADPEMPTQVLGLSVRILWSTVSRKIQEYKNQTSTCIFMIWDIISKSKMSCFSRLCLTETRRKHI